MAVPGHLRHGYRASSSSTPLVREGVTYVTMRRCHGRVLWGAFFEVLLVIANIATAVPALPVLKRSTKAWRCFVAARVIECVFICVGAPQRPDGRDASRRDPR
jgi:hypothetical protein